MLRFFIKKSRNIGLFDLYSDFMQEKVGAIVMLKLSMKQNGFQSMLSPWKPYISGFFGVFQI